MKKPSKRRRSTRSVSTGETKAASEQPIVRHGDVVAVLHGEIGNVFAELNRGRALLANLQAYAEAHPTEHAHLTAYLSSRPS